MHNNVSLFRFASEDIVINNESDEEKCTDKWKMYKTSYRVNPSFNFLYILRNQCIKCKYILTLE